MNTTFVSRTFQAHLGNIMSAQQHVESSSLSLEVAYQPQNVSKEPEIDCSHAEIKTTASDIDDLLVNLRVNNKQQQRQDQKQVVMAGSRQQRKVTAGGLPEDILVHLNRIGDKTMQRSGGGDQGADGRWKIDIGLLDELERLDQGEAHAPCTKHERINSGRGRFYAAVEAASSKSMKNGTASSTKSRRQTKWNLQPPSPLRFETAGADPRTLENHAHVSSMSQHEKQVAVPQLSIVSKSEEVLRPNPYLDKSSIQIESSMQDVLIQKAKCLEAAGIANGVATRILALDGVGLEDKMQIFQSLNKIVDLLLPGTERANI
jgi:hypothetical protein